MLIANIAYLANLLILIAYLILWEDKSTWPSKILIWAWAPFVLSLYMDHFFDGVQNSARNLSRICFIKKYGHDYNKTSADLLAHMLIPSNLGPLFFLWNISRVASFSIILLFQGWATALMAELSLVILGVMIPIGYNVHLRRIRQSFSGLSIHQMIKLSELGISISEVARIVNQAVAENKNPQVWWGEVVRDALRDARRGQPS
jgi:hypothetical protein